MVACLFALLGSAAALASSPFSSSGVARGLSYQWIVTFQLDPGEVCVIRLVSDVPVNSSAAIKKLDPNYNTRVYSSWKQYQEAKKLWSHA